MQFLRERVRIARIADSDGGDGLAVCWNFEDLFGFSGVKAGHLVKGKTSRGGFNAEQGSGGAGVVEGVAIWCAIVVEVETRRRQERERELLWPSRR